MKKMFSLSALLVCSVLVCLAAGASLSGEWSGTLRTGDGNEYPLLYNFKVDGDKLTGTARGPHGDLPITDGEVHGASFTFDVKLDKLHLLHTGKFYPDSVSLNIESDDAQAHTTLVRVNK